MNAFGVLKAARVAGVVLGVDGDDVVLKAPRAPSPSLLELLAQHKSVIVALLRRDPECGAIADLEDCFEERAAILEYDGGLARPAAEARALERCLQELARRDEERGGE